MREAMAGRSPSGARHEPIRRRGSAAGKQVADSIPAIDKSLKRRIKSIVGKEVLPLKINRILGTLVRRLASPSFGFIISTCVDETETDSRARLERSPLARLLPALPGGARSPLVSTTIGGSFVPETIAIAESHFGTESPLTLLIKVQTHCGVSGEEAGRQYGILERYGARSEACAAMKWILDGRLDAAPVREINDGLDPAILETFRCDPDGRGALLLAAHHAKAEVERADAHCRKRPAGNVYVFFGSVNLNGLSSPIEYPVILRVLDRRGNGDTVWENDLGAIAE